MSTKNIILDIGNVICRWDPERLVNGVFGDPSVYAEAHAATIGHPDWLALDCGTLTLEEAIANAQSRSSLDPAKIEAVYHQTPASLTPVEDTITAIREAHAAGAPLYVLSNMQTHAWQYLAQTFDFWSCFTGVCVSCEANLLKPDAAIYEHVINTFGLDREASVFIDDMPVNIEGCTAVGLPGIVLEDPDLGAGIIRELVAGAGRD